MQNSFLVGQGVHRDFPVFGSVTTSLALYPTFFSLFLLAIFATVLHTMPHSGITLHVRLFSLSFFFFFPNSFSFLFLFSFGLLLHII